MENVDLKIFEIAFQNSPEITFILDKDGKIITYNHGFPETSYDRDKIIGSYFYDLPIKFVSNKTQDILKQNFIKRMNGEPVTPYNIEIIKENGEIFYGQISGNLVCDEDNIKYSIITILDITFYVNFINHYKNFINAIKESTKKVVKSNEILEEFIYIISHDLITPINKIKLLNGLLKNECEKDEFNINKIFELSEKIEKSANWSERLINDLLSYSRLLYGDDLKLKIDLNHIINDIIVSYKDNNIQFLIDQLPCIYGYETQIIQLFNNLINNSIKFRKDDEQLIIKISYEDYKLEDTSFHKISIIDNGIGFNNKYSENIFKIFKRLHSNAKYDGTGIGLAICQKIVERHGGKIIANGKLNVGATFSILFPY